MCASWQPECIYYVVISCCKDSYAASSDHKLHKLQVANGTWSQQGVKHIETIIIVALSTMVLLMYGVRAAAVTLVGW